MFEDRFDLAAKVDGLGRVSGYHYNQSSGESSNESA
jgi:hypothetical protein